MIAVRAADMILGKEQLRPIKATFAFDVWGRIAGVLINLGEEKPCYRNYFTKITF
jgi:hypothetical protein